MTPFPIGLGTPIRFPGPPPAACDVVVIGGGIIGVMTAWHLCERGFKVVLCEKGRIAGEQSGRNWGWIRQQGRDLAELPIMVESLAIWKSLAAEVGTALGFRQSGVTYLAKSDSEMLGYANWLPHATALGVDTRMMSRAEVSAQLPGHRANWCGGLITPSDARAEPWVAVPLLAHGAARRGATLIENCAVRAIDIAAGRVAGVVTEQGHIGCDQVVVAGGAWSSHFLRGLGVNIPQLSVRASVAATEPMPEFHAGAAADNDFAWRRRADGGYTIAPGARHDFYLGPDAFRHFRAFLPVLRKDFRSTNFSAAAPAGYPDAWTTRRHWDADQPSPYEAMRVLNPEPNMKIIGNVVAAFVAAFPGIDRPRLRAAWAGMIDTMPDTVPVVDRIAKVPGLTVATGFSGHGFGIGPGMGRVVADLVAGRPTGHDLHRFRSTRFSDGSRMVPGPSL